MARKIFEQDPEKFIPALAAALKKVPEFEAPEWVAFVKTGTSRERPPVAEDFWYTRAASVLRQLYIKGVLGVGKLRSRYGSRKDRGGKPDDFRKAGGKIIRVILQQAEKAGLVERMNRMQHGRRLTTNGRDFLDSIEVEEKKGFDFDDLKIKRIAVPAEAEVIEEDTESIEGTEEDSNEENGVEDGKSESEKSE